MMSNGSARKTGRELVARGDRGRLQPGTVSLNPKGRPRRGETRAEHVRRQVDWELVDARMIRIITNPKSKDHDAIAAWIALNDRGFGRPISSHELTIGVSSGVPSRDLSAMPLEERRALLAKIRALPLLTTASEEAEPEAIEAESSTVK